LTDTATDTGVVIRAVNEMDTSAIEAIDEKIVGAYRPEHWETRVAYYVSRDPDAALVAEIDGEVKGFLFADIRGWEFGLDQPTGWVEVVGVDPDAQGRGLGRKLAEALFAHMRSEGVTQVRTMVDDADEPIARFMQSIGLEKAPVTTYCRTI
jgi:ribosomal protein S18 acetylase RimI-like enzyme